MAKKVAVEEGLDNVVDELQRRGYGTVELLPESFNWDNVEAAVVSGGDSNFMGMEDRASTVPVVSAEGLTAEEVVDAIEQRLRARERS
ncbi:MAG: YkuS family protein [Chloroflexota bacterium]